MPHKTPQRRKAELATGSKESISCLRKLRLITKNQNSDDKLQIQTESSILCSSCQKEEKYAVITPYDNHHITPMVFNLQSSATKHSQQWQNGSKMDFKVTKATLEIVSDEACQKDRNIFARGNRATASYVLLSLDVFRKIFPTELVLGFNLWGRGVVPRKCILAGTLLEPSWNYLGTFVEACWNHVGTLPEPCQNLFETLAGTSWNHLDSTLGNSCGVSFWCVLFPLFFLSSCFVSMLSGFA